MFKWRPKKQEIINYKNEEEMNKIDKLKFKEGDEIVTPEVAKDVILKFLIDEIGPFVESGFKEERIQLTAKIDEEVKRLKAALQEKLDKVSEEIFRELKSSKVKEEIRLQVEAKFEKLKKGLLEDESK
jgi:hypothetical protein